MTETESEFEQRKSKSQIKREMQALRDLGQRLVELPGQGLNNVPISEKLREAVLLAKKLKREALRRQLSHIGNLLKDEEVEAIQVTLEHLDQPHRAEVRRLHQLEQWRDSLIGGDDALMSELLVRFEVLDRQHLRQLIRNARREREQNKPPKSARALFQYLSELEFEE